MVFSTTARVDAFADAVEPPRRRAALRRALEQAQERFERSVRVPTGLPPGLTLQSVDIIETKGTITVRLICGGEYLVTISQMRTRDGASIELPVDDDVIPQPVGVPGKQGVWLEEVPHSIGGLPSEEAPDVIGGPFPGAIGQQYSNCLGALFGAFPNTSEVNTLLFRSSLIFLGPFYLSWVPLTLLERRHQPMRLGSEDERPSFLQSLPRAPRPNQDGVLWVCRALAYPI